MSGTSTIILGLNQSLRIEFEGHDGSFNVFCSNDECDGIEIGLSEAVEEEGCVRHNTHLSTAVPGLSGTNPTVAVLDEVAELRTRHLKPTVKLRWFIPTIPTSEAGGIRTSKNGVLVLQQWWTDDHQDYGEWVDVDSVRAS